MKIWNTEDLLDHEQFAYWREVLCEAFVTLRPERPREQSTGGFPSRVTACPLSTINVTTVQSKAHHVIRGNTEIRKSPQEVYFVNLQLTGRCRYETEGRETIIGPNEFAVVNSTRPYFLDAVQRDSVGDRSHPKLAHAVEYGIAGRVARDRLRERVGGQVRMCQIGRAAEEFW